MPAPAVVLELVERFRRNREAYRSATYNETQVRREFIDPFFKALGWDVENLAGYAQAYKDVIHEDAMKIGRATKAPDYCFRIGGARKFFVEAKRPGVDLKTNPEPAYQLRRYAWSARLPLSILTDFEEFAVYDCRIRPAASDKASAARTMWLTCDDYDARWDEIAALFSRDAVLKGDFDRYAESTRKKRGTAEVDAAFLKEIEGWREVLAQSFALRNPGLGVRELNFAVQRTIDRIVFLRLCEDRGIEPYGQLQGLIGAAPIYPRLGEVFRRADEKYNSSLFYFTPERGREPPDDLTLGLSLDDKPLREILRSLYYPECPYEFSVIPAEILGQVYEQFLGKVIRLTAGHRAKVEEKPEVRKAGGVYYTPSYIVDYIVRNTVGELLAARAPGDFELAPKRRPSRRRGADGERRPAAERGGGHALRIIDPACGSGSFLLGAYTYLLNWYRDAYLADGAGTHPDRLYQGAGGHWHLTIQEKKRILLTHVFGVDIDRQAVETTKLSLLLKVLEGETAETLGSTLRLFHERALPDLDGNIKCGNSLIGPEFYNGQQLSLMDEDERLRVNVFDWKSEFPAVFRGGTPGFDAVIGNPPYGAAFSTAEQAYLRHAYRTPANSLDSFLLFVERSGVLLCRGGALGFVVPSGWVSLPSAKPLRSHFLETFRPRSFVSLPFDVFGGAYIDCVVLTATRRGGTDADGGDAVDLIVFPSRHKIQSIDDFISFHKTTGYRLWLSSPDREFLVTCSADESQLLNKIRNSSRRLGDAVLVKRGIESFDVAPTARGLENPKRAFTGVLQRYVLQQGPRGFVAYVPDVARSKPIEYFAERRILLRQVLSRSLRLQAVLASEAFLTNQSVQSLLPNPGAKPVLPLSALLAILNSRLLSWYFVKLNAAARRDDFPKIIIQQTRDLPLPPLVAPERARLSRAASHVDLMLRLQTQLAAARTAHDKTAIQRQIDALDNQIDTLVYELYGLTDDEIAVVETDSAR